MLTDLATAVEHLRVQLDLAEAEALEARNRRVEWVTAAVAAVAVPMTLVLGFLGINVKPIAGDKTVGDVWSQAYVSWYAWLIGIPLTVMVLVWWRASRRRR